MAKRKIKKVGISTTIQEAFSRFITSGIARGLSEKTIQTYNQHIHSISKHLDLSLTFAELSQEDLDGMIVSMRRSGLAHNSISSYTRVFRTFLKWCGEQGLTELEIPHLKDKETVKETYTDYELQLLLRKPSRNCSFCEYRKCPSSTGMSITSLPNSSMTEPAR